MTHPAPTPLCPACRLPLPAIARRELAAQILSDRIAKGHTQHDVTCWECKACGLPAWGWDWDDE